MALSLSEAVPVPPISVMRFVVLPWRYSWRVCSLLCYHEAVDLLLLHLLVFELLASIPSLVHESVHSSLSRLSLFSVSVSRLYIGGFLPLQVFKASRSFVPL